MFNGNSQDSQLMSLAMQKVSRSSQDLLSSQGCRKLFRDNQDGSQPIPSFGSGSSSGFFEENRQTSVYTEALKQQVLKEQQELQKTLGALQEKRRNLHAVQSNDMHSQPVTNPSKSFSQDIFSSQNLLDTNVYTPMKQMMGPSNFQNTPIGNDYLQFQASRPVANQQAFGRQSGACSPLPASPVMFSQPLASSVRVYTFLYFCS